MENRIQTAGVQPFPPLQHLLDLRALGLRLGATQVAGDDRVIHGASKAGDVRFRTVGQRSNHHVPAVVGEQLGRHALELGGMEEVEEQRLDHIVPVVPQRDFGRTQFLGRAVDHAPPQTRTQ